MMTMTSKIKMVEGPVREFNTALFTEFAAIKDRNNKLNYKGTGYLHAPILTIRTTLGHWIVKVVVQPDNEFEIGRANTNMPEHPNKYVIMPYNDDFVSRLVAKFLYKNDGDVTFTLVKVAEDSDPLTYPKWKVDDEEIDSPQKNLVITLARGAPKTITHMVTEKFGYNIEFEWPLMRCKTVSYRAQILAGPETLPIDLTQEYDNGAGAPAGAGGAGGAGRASGAGGAGGAGAAVNVIDDKVVKDIIDRLDKTQIVNAYHIYSMNPDNKLHMDDLRAEIDTKFPEGTPVPFGKPNQVAKAWWKWAKEEANADIVKVYAKIATDFNLENKDNRPERKKRQANDKKGPKTKARKYVEDSD